MRRVILVNRYFHPDHSATAQLLSDLAFALAGQGCEVCVVTSQQTYEDPEASLPRQETVASVRVVRVPTTRFGRQGLWGRGLDYASFHLAAAWALLGQTRTGDVVVAETDPPLISLVAALVAWVRGARLVNWVQDLFPEVACALGVRGSSAAAALLTGARNLSLRAAATNVVLGGRMAGRLRGLGVPPERITVIHNWSDGRQIRPVAHEANPLRAEWGLQGRFVVGYSGNMGRAHEFESLLEAAWLLRDEPGIAFLFIGGGARRVEIEAQARSRGLGNVIFKPYQPRERLMHSLGAPDLHVISLRPELEGLIVPSKFYGIAAAGRPTLYIGDPDGEIPRILREEACGVTVRPGDAEGLANQVRGLAADAAECARMGVRARLAFERRFDFPLAMRGWQTVLRQGAHPVYAAETPEAPR